MLVNLIGFSYGIQGLYSFLSSLTPELWMLKTFCATLISIRLMELYRLIN